MRRESHNDSNGNPEAANAKSSEEVCSGSDQSELSRRKRFQMIGRQRKRSQRRSRRKRFQRRSERKRCHMRRLKEKFQRKGGRRNEGVRERRREGRSSRNPLYLAVSNGGRWAPKKRFDGRKYVDFRNSGEQWMWLDGALREERGPTEDEVGQIDGRRRLWASESTHTKSMRK